MLSHPLHPIMIPLAQAPSGGMGSLVDGQQLATLVQGNAEQPYLMIAGTRVPVPESALLPGQAVLVEVATDAGALHLRVTPQPVTAPSTTENTPLAQLATTVLARLGAMEAPPHPEVLAPAALPIGRDNLQELFSLLLLRNHIGEDLQQLHTILQQAVQEGILSPTLLGELGLFTLPVDEWEPASLQSWLKTLHRNSKPEAKLLAALRQGSVETIMQGLRQTLVQQLQDLRGRDALLHWMRTKGMLKHFEHHLTRITEQLAKTDLQNLHQLEQPYAFLELPLPPDTGIHYAQLHFFAEGRSQQQQSSRFNSVVIDIATTKLGALWINLQTHDATCQCRFQVTEEHIAQHIAEHRPDLEHSLQAHGYNQVVIQTALWDGERLRALTGLMTRFQRLDVSS